MAKLEIFQFPTRSDNCGVLLHDPQTSGGLLIAVPADRLTELVEALKAEGALTSAVVGDVRPRDPLGPFVTFG